jgi:uncharacterized membrane protein YphA (DoxX/SURF4 family)
MRGWIDVSTVLGRWVVGTCFIYMGLSKALYPAGFLKLVRQYELVHDPVLLNSLAAVLPWLEVFCGLLLLAGVAVRGTALTLAGMLLPFTAVVWQRALALQAAQGIPFCAVKFDCGCGVGEVYICSKLLENAALLAVAVWLLWGRGRQLSLRYEVGRQNLHAGG